jgi:hypothetical protein
VEAGIREPMMAFGNRTLKALGGKQRALLAVLKSLQKQAPRCSVEKRGSFLHGSRRTARGRRAAMSKNSKNMKIVSFDGPPCPRCGCPTEIREHERITEKEIAKHYYYSRWYNCGNAKCQTNIIHADEFKVWNENKAQRPHDVATPTEQRDHAPGLLDRMSAGDPPPWE